MSEKPRIVFFDLETLPDLRGALEQWPSLSNFPGLTFRATINSICCFGYMWEGEAQASCLTVWDEPKRWARNRNDDSALCQAAYDILCEADVVVTQNGKAFDWKFLQTRLLLHGLPPLPRILHVDTKQLAKTNLFMFSNSLKHLAKKLTSEEKQENEGWELWVRTHDGDAAAMREMSEYCKQDVFALSKIFERLRPFAREIPNYNNFRKDGIDVCPNCGGYNLIGHGRRVTKTCVYERVRCKDCGTASMRDKKRRPVTL